jgi:ABC-type dipeptide/oligopeptide/nickel transport system ATPase component
MRAGQFVELGPAEMIVAAPEADYTLELLAAVPQRPRNPFV